MEWKIINPAQPGPVAGYGCEESLKIKTKREGDEGMDRRKNMCCRIVPIYYGDRPAATRGKPNEGKDWYFRCYASYDIQTEVYREANTINDLCDGCKKYLYFKPLTKDEIREKYYSGKPREVMVVTKTGWHFKEV